ncbi:MAG: hopanoid biosynthesis-associated protein HpnK [Novosphingobium sp.]
MRGLIVTADDFGAALAVNEAVEQAHVDGILTAASLMVSGAAAEDAVARAKRLPGLGVGLHIALADAAPVLPPERIPALVGSDGRFHEAMLRTSLAIAASASARRQLAAEIEAQFAAFAATGLALDHVNAHKHFHLHPMIASAILRIGPKYGMKAMRVPYERGGTAPLRWWARQLRARLRRAGLTVNDRFIGLGWTGAMDAIRMREAVATPVDGLIEIYCHPATNDDWTGHAPGYRYRDELAALLDPAAKALLERSDVRRGSFADFTASLRMAA